MPAPRILICGAGIAGSTLAYWLAKNDFEVVVVERSPAKQTAGQGIDIEGPALEVVKLMGGIVDKIKQRTTGELGFTLVDEQYRSWGTFDTDEISLTRSIEIMRGDLAEILYEAADESTNVTFKFQTTIQSLRHTADKVIVDFGGHTSGNTKLARETEDETSTTTETEEFDVVVGADGVRSRTRQLAMGSPEKLDCFKPVGASCAFFSIAKEERDWPRSRFCQFPGRRSLCIRPRGKESNVSSAYLGYFHDDNSALHEAQDAGDRNLQKEAMAKLFADLGWEVPRVLEQMLKAENFYFERLTQVKLAKWHQDRVVLVGDAAYAPTPLSGQGTALALLGAYVLAQELSRNRNDEATTTTAAAAAFERYQKRLRAYVENAQTFPLGGYLPYIVNPQTSWGIWLVRRIVSFISWSKLSKIIPDPGAAEFDLEV